VPKRAGAIPFMRPLILRPVSNTCVKQAVQRRSLCTAILSVEERPGRLNLPDASFSVSTKHAHSQISALQFTRRKFGEVSNFEDHGWKLERVALRTCKSLKWFTYRCKYKMKIISQSHRSYMAINLNRIENIYRNFSVE
jgi:hypothetical protein